MTAFPATNPAPRRTQLLHSLSRSHVPQSESSAASLLLHSPALPVVPAREKSNKKGQKKAKKGGKKQRDEEDSGDESDNDDGPSASFDVGEARGAFEESVAALQRRLERIRVTSAGPAAVSSLRVRVDGETQPVVAVAQLVVKDPQTLELAPFDLGDLRALGDAAKAETSGGILEGSRVEVDAEKVRLILPKVTREHRERLAAAAQKELTTTLEGLRGKRQKAMTAIKAAGLPKDDKRKVEAEVQGLVDSTTKACKAALEQKVKELKTS